MHKAFPHQEGLNGKDGKVLWFSFTLVHILGGTTTRNNGTTKKGNVAIPVSSNYQRLTTYGFDPLGKPSDGYDKDTTYDLRVSTVFLEISRIEDIC